MTGPSPPLSPAVRDPTPIPSMAGHRSQPFRRNSLPDWRRDLTPLCSPTPTFSGGVGAYMISFDGGSFQPGTSPTTFSGLAPGNHTVDVKDVATCVAHIETIITEPPLLTTGSSATAILCNGGNSTVTISA